MDFDETVKFDTLVGKSKGFSAPIKHLAGDEVLVSRLMELGIVRGETIVLRGQAPFGDPYLVEVKGLVVALRKEEVLCIHL
ncbi:MAG: ferrous iron transport protein A [Bdellovibrionales bacterium]|nr:ferrous iron transport protein A [Bdellovibrionales bacterium]